MNSSSNVSDLDLLKHARSGDDDALNEILLRHRERLKRMVSVRMNQKLKGRLDASDVIQETFIEASRTLDNYLKNPKLPVFLWLRCLAGEKLIQAHRHHLGTKKRAVDREQGNIGGAPAATSQALAFQISASMTSPSLAVEKQEAKDQLLNALENMDQLDREILTLRHFEHLSSRETAELVGLSLEAVKKRYVRALDKLQKTLLKLN